MDREFLTLMARDLKARLPDNYSFILLAAPNEHQGDGRLVYTASMTRESAIAVMKEFLIRAGAAEDWMQHIK